MLRDPRSSRPTTVSLPGWVVAKSAEDVATTSQNQVLGVCLRGRNSECQASPHDRDLNGDDAMDTLTAVRWRLVPVDYKFALVHSRTASLHVGLFEQWMGDEA
jgi:hypothetical protein